MPPRLDTGTLTKISRPGTVPGLVRAPFVWPNLGLAAPLVAGSHSGVPRANNRSARSQSSPSSAPSSHVFHLWQGHKGLEILNGLRW